MQWLQQNFQETKKKILDMSFKWNCLLINYKISPKKSRKIF